MARYRVQVCFQAKDALPRDQMENVWHFRTAAVPIAPGDYDDINTKLTNFYAAEAGTSPATIASRMSSTLSEAVIVKFYDEDSLILPRPLLTTRTFAMVTGSDPGLPEEIALCMSYYSAENVARKRGRLYLGPFAQTANHAGDAGDVPSASRPDTVLLSSIANAGEALIAASATGAQWCVRSGIGAGTKAAPVVTYFPITNGWIDNEWDSQRRRRITATARVLFNATTEG